MLKMSAENVFTFTWKIDNYSKLNSKVGDRIDSDTFVTNFSGRDEWCLHLFSNGWKQEADDVYCFLCRKAGTRLITVDCTFHLIDPLNKVFITKQMSTQIYKNMENWGACLLTVERLKNEVKPWKEDVLTIRCLLSIQKSTEKSSPDYESQTTIGVNHDTFAWHIKKPGSLEWSPSKTFTFAEITSLEATLTAPADDIIIEIKNKPFVAYGHFSVTCKITLLDKIDIGHCSATDEYRFDNTDPNSMWCFPKFLTKSELEEKNCIQNGYFTLIIEFFVRNGIDSKEDKSRIKYEIISKARAIHDIDGTMVLQKDFKKMYLDKKFSDVSLKVDGELFCAHKCVLSSRSSIFQAMFDCEMLENETNVVNIIDLDSTTLGNFLQFLYTGTIDCGNGENILKLILAADKYQVQSLVEKCALILMSSLTDTNVCDVFGIADMIKHKILKALALEFIKKNATTILNTEEWSAWAKQNIDLSSEIITNLAKELSNKSN